MAIGIKSRERMYEVLRSENANKCFDCIKKILKEDQS